MIRPSMKATSLAAICGLAVAGCASTPPLEAVLNAPEGPCAEQPDLAAALLLEAPRGNRTTAEAAALDATASCLDGGTGSENSWYALARIPDAETDLLLTASGANEFRRVLALTVRMLDENGETVRTFDRERYIQMSDGYSLQIRPRENEAFILATTAPDLVGETVDSIHLGINTTYYSTGYVTSQYHSGSDTNYSRQFSHEGAVIFKLVNVE